MYLLNQEYIFSLFYRHRDERAAALYLADFDLSPADEPFPLFTGKFSNYQGVLDRFLLHGIDLVYQTKPLVAMLAKHPWYPRNYFDYLNNQLKLQLPQNFQFQVIDLGTAKPREGWLLRQLMRSVGLRHILKEDASNLNNFQRFLGYQEAEYRKKFYFVLFRSDNLSFAQLAFLKKINQKRPPEELPLAYFLLEGGADTYHHFLNMRKDSLDKELYDTFFVLHRGSYDTAINSIDVKLGRPIRELIAPEYLRLLHIAADGQLLEPLIHSSFARMAEKKIKRIQTNEQFQEIFSEIKKENEVFISRSSTYKRKLENKDYIFPPAILRDGPSFNEARKFFEWLGWQK